MSDHWYKWYQSLFATYTRHKLTLRKCKFSLRLHDSAHNSTWTPTQSEAFVTDISHGPFISALCVLHMLCSYKWSNSHLMKAAACAIRGLFFPIVYALVILFIINTWKQWEVLVCNMPLSPCTGVAFLVKIPQFIVYLLLQL